MDPYNFGSADQSNHQVPTSVFNFDAYPATSPVTWNCANPFTLLGAQCSPDAAPASAEAFTSFAQTPSTSTKPAVNQRQPRIVPFAYPKTSFSFGRPRLPHEIVHFPFHITNVDSKKRDFRFKRKTESPPLQPLKQHITEEKMADHMSRLHISSETASSVETNRDQVQRLYMCEEMRKFQCDTILPQRIVSLIQKPCTAVVLWKPPVSLVPDFEAEGTEQVKSTCEDKEMENEDVENGVSNMDF